MSSRSFNPGFYIDTNSLNHSDEFNTTLTVKGSGSSSGSEININELKHILKQLREYHYLQIKDLQGTLKEGYHKVAKYVSLLWSTNSYDILENLIDEEFESLGISQLRPATLGAYFKGLKVQTNMHDQSCSHLGAGSMPSNTQDFTVCERSVLLAQQNGRGGYDISVLTKGNNKRRAYVFVEHESYESFFGFSADEMKQLVNHGITDVQFFGYSDDNNDVKELSETMKLDSCKTRKGNTNYRSSSGSNYWWLILLVVIIILIIIVVMLQSAKA